MSVQIADRPRNQTTQAPPSPKVNQEKILRYLQVLRDQQNLGYAVVAGAGAALIGAIAWAAVTAATMYQIGWMAVGVGFLVGCAVRFFGKGIDPVFGYVGAGLAAVGCVVGNLLAICIMAASQHGVPFLEVVSALTPGVAVELLKATFNPMDLLFYGLAVYEGYRFSFRQVTHDELEKAAAA